MRRMERIKTGWAGSFLIVAVYLAGHFLLVLSATLYWHPPAGWRFLFLLFTPKRLWPWLLLGEWAIYLPNGLQMFTGHDGLMTLFTLARMAGLMSGPWLLLRAASPLLSDNARSMQHLLGAIFASALGNAVFNAWRPFEDAETLTTLQIFLQLILGDVNGMLLLVPLGLMLLLYRPARETVQRWRFDAACILLPSLLLYGVVILNSPQHVYFFATSLCALPVLYFALRSGWRGVAVSFPIASLAVATASIASGNIAMATQVQLFLVVVGVASLLLGASVDELSARNRVLELANSRLDRASEDLREAARRNLGLSEDVRRWITSELHDELGQNLTALQTRLKLAEREAGASGQFAPAWDIIAHMRQSVSGLMASLRPAGLDEFGLASALQGGAIRELAESAGLAYRIRIEDDDNLLDRLGNDTQTAIYRIVQEAATNAVRHADASRIEVLLRARRIRDCISIGLSVVDDGRGIAMASKHPHKPGIGLQGIRDRVLVLGGRMRLRSGAEGTTLITTFNCPGLRQALPAT
jgi:two-component system sensor histidine kinase UhpB